MNQHVRVKTYSAETGIVYQYSFAGQRAGRRRWFLRGTEFLFDVSPDRRSNFRVLVFLPRAVSEAWAGKHARALSPPEQYAAAKLRLLAAFDESENLPQQALDIEITAERLEEFLARLDIG